MAADSRTMDRRSFKGSWFAREYQSGCACAVGLTETVANGRRMGLRRDSVVKAAMPPPEPISSSDDRLTSAADKTGAGDERINRGREYSRGHHKDSETKGQGRLRQAAVTDLSCGIRRPKGRGSQGHGLGLGLGCRTAAELGDEHFTKISIRRTVRTEESAEAVINQKFIDGEKSKQFMEALYILNSNKSLFEKLLEDPNSLLAKHIRELRESGKNGRKSEGVSDLEMVRKMGKEEGVGTLSPRKMKIWEKLFPWRSAEKDKSCDIVVLKPGLEYKHTRGNRRSFFGSGGGSENGIRVVRQSRLPFRSLRKISKHRMGGNPEHSGVEATKLTVAPSYECKELDWESFVRKLSRENQVEVSSSVGHAEVAAVDDSIFMETDDVSQLSQTTEESAHVTQIHSWTSLSPDLVVNNINELEHVDILQEIRRSVVCRDQTSSSSLDGSFSNATEESETSSDDRPEDEHESPVSVLDHHVASPIDAPPKPDWTTWDMPPDKFGRAAEFLKSIFTSSDLSWDTMLPNYDSQNQLLGDTGSSRHESGIDARLLRDYSSEVLCEAIQHQWRSYQLGLVVDSDVASVLMTRVDWDLVLPRAQDSKTLERIITSDVTMEKWSHWMRLVEETDEIVVELTGKIVEDVVDEIL